MDYDLQTLSIGTSATNPDDTTRVAKLDQLLNLAKRWTREFKAEYIKRRGDFHRRGQLRKHHNQPHYTQAELLAHIQTEQAVLSPTEPHYEVHSTVLAALLEQARLAAWETELGLIWDDDVSEQAA